MSTSNTLQLNEFRQQCQQRVDQRLGAALDAEIVSATLLEAMRYACLGKGKRIRPVLAYASVLAVGGELTAADNAAAAIELIHSYSLVHDDLPAMDDDDLRRGKPTVHKAFNEATAILVGDALQSLAFQILSTETDVLGANNRLAMVQLLSQAAGATGMVGGQSLDFEAVGVKLSIQQLEQMHSLKTGALIRCAVLLGGMSCGSSSERFGELCRQYRAGIPSAGRYSGCSRRHLATGQTTGLRQRQKQTHLCLSFGPR